MSRGAEKVSIRQFDPALVAAEAGHIGGIPDLLRNIVEDPAVPHRAVVVDEGLSPDDLDPPGPLEILASEAAPLLKIDEFEHGSAVLSCCGQQLFQSLSFHNFTAPLNPLAKISSPRSHFLAAPLKSFLV